MAGFSYVQALGAGFHVLRRKPWAVLAWAGAYLILAVLPLTLIMSQVLPDVVATYREAAHAVTQGGTPDPARALALRSKVSGLKPLVWLIQLLAYTILLGAAFRAVLEPQASRWADTRARFPVASLIATILGCLAIEPSVSTEMSATVRDGTLYTTIGSGEASAIARKCAASPAWLGLL